MKDALVSPHDAMQLDPPQHLVNHLWHYSWKRLVIGWRDVAICVACGMVAKPGRK